MSLSLRLYLYTVSLLGPLLIAGTWLIFPPPLERQPWILSALILFGASIIAERRPVDVQFRLGAQYVESTVTLTATFALALGVILDPPTGALAMYIASALGRVSPGNGVGPIRHAFNAAQEAIAVYVAVGATTLVAGEPLAQPLVLVLSFSAGAVVLGLVNALLTAIAYYLSHGRSVRSVLRQMATAIVMLMVVTTLFSPLVYALRSQPLLVLIAAAHFVSLRELAERTWAESSQQFSAREIANAIRRGEIVAYYQPIVRARTGRMASLEALVRWCQPDGSVAPADVLMQTVERAEMERVFQHHLIDVVERDVAEYDLPLPVSINIRVAVLMETSVRTRLRNAEQIVSVELLEHDVIEHPDEVAEILRDLAIGGVLTDIDDFGSGATSIAWLSSLPVRRIKLDRRFIGNFDGVSSAVSVATFHGLDTVLEGVETPVHLHQAVEAGVDFVQGYLYTKPLPPCDMRRWLDDQPVNGV